MFYLTMHSTTFYLQLLGIGHMVKDHSAHKRDNSGRKEMFYLTTHSRHFIYGYMAKHHSHSERGNLLLPHRLLFPISSKGSFIMHHPTYRIIHTTAFVTPVVEHWLEREIAQWVQMTRCHHFMGYSFLLAARNILYTPSVGWCI